MADRAKAAFLQQLRWRVLTTKQIEKAIINHLVTGLEREAAREHVTFDGEDAMDAARSMMESISESVEEAVYSHFENQEASRG